MSLPTVKVPHVTPIGKPRGAGVVGGDVTGNHRGDQLTAVPKQSVIAGALKRTRSMQLRGMVPASAAHNAARLLANRQVVADKPLVPIHHSQLLQMQFMSDKNPLRGALDIQRASGHLARTGTFQNGSSKRQQHVTARTAGLLFDPGVPYGEALLLNTPLDHEAAGDGDGRPPPRNMEELCKLLMEDGATPKLALRLRHITGNAVPEPHSDDYLPLPNDPYALHFELSRHWNDPEQLEERLRRAQAYRKRDGSEATARLGQQIKDAARHLEASDPTVTSQVAGAKAAAELAATPGAIKLTGFAFVEAYNKLSERAPGTERPRNESFVKKLTFVLDRLPEEELRTGHVMNAMLRALRDPLNAATRDTTYLESIVTEIKDIWGMKSFFDLSGKTADSINRQEAQRRRQNNS